MSEINILNPKTELDKKRQNSFNRQIKQRVEALESLAPYIHIQETPAANWNVEHKKGIQYLPVFVANAFGQQVTYTDENNLIIHFGINHTGIAIIG